jgi:uncharacterized membrane protein YgdD (TMEM256/DUF423 family)
MTRVARIGAGVLGMAVGLGAMAAHMLKPVLTEAQAASWQTGVLYQILHGLALLIIGLSGVTGRNVRIAVWLFCIGIVIFSGGLYINALTGFKPLGRVIPLGGMAWIVGWFMLAFAGAGRQVDKRPGA